MCGKLCLYSDGLCVLTCVFCSSNTYMYVLMELLDYLVFYRLTSGFVGAPVQHQAL